MKAKEILGNQIGCGRCNGTGKRIINYASVLSTPIPGSDGKVLKDLLIAMSGKDSISYSILDKIIGNRIYCPECIHFCKVPQKARNNWVAEFVDGNGVHKGWLRLVIDESK